MIDEVNWNVFTLEETAVIKQLVEMQQRDHIAQGVLEMTPEKEAELQKIGNLLRPVPQEFESEALKQWKISRMKENKNPDPETPEEEAQLQKILDAEIAALQATHKKKAEQRQETLEKNVKSTPSIKKLATA